MFRFNIPVTKVDEEKRLVYGLVTEEVVDQAGEILDYETSKAYFQEWSDGVSKATNGASLGNLRLMHQPIIAGKLVELVFDDVLKQISCVARIVSDDVWKLVLEGCLTGFSMGGKYIKRWKDETNKTVMRFTAKPVEVSVVDNPCVSTATFEYIKSDGSTELRKFHPAGDGNEGDQSMPTAEQIAARAAELAKAAGTPDAGEQFLAEAETLLAGEMEAEALARSSADAAEADEAPAPASEETASVDTAVADEAARTDAAKALVQVWQAPDGTTFSKKADGVDHVLAAPVEEPESPVEKALREARGNPEPDAAPALEGGLLVLDGDLEKALAAYTAAEEHILPLAKSMYSVRSLASVITDLRYVIADIACEHNVNGQTTSVAASLMDHLRGLAQGLVTLTEEEVATMITSLGSNYPTILGTVENAAVAEIAKADSSIMQKAGARNSKTDATKIQTMHDHACDLGATCATTKAVIADEALEETDLVKALRVDISQRDTEIAKAVSGIAELGDSVRAQSETIAELTTRVEKFGKTPQPLPPRSDHVVVERFGKTQTIGQEDIEKMSPAERAELAIRLSQTAPLAKIGG